LQIRCNYELRHTFIQSEKKRKEKKRNKNSRSVVLGKRKKNSVHLWPELALWLKPPLLMSKEMLRETIKGKSEH